MIVQGNKQKEKKCYTIALVVKMFDPGGLFIQFNAYVSEDRNEIGRFATPTSCSIFDSNDTKSLLFKFGHHLGILRPVKISQALHVIKQNIEKLVGVAIFPPSCFTS